MTDAVFESGRVLEVSQQTGFACCGLGHVVFSFLAHAMASYTSSAVTSSDASFRRTSSAEVAVGDAGLMPRASIFSVSR